MSELPPPSAPQPSAFPPPVYASVMDATPSLVEERASEPEFEPEPKPKKSRRRIWWVLGVIAVLGVLALTAALVLRFLGGSGNGDSSISVDGVDFSTSSDGTADVGRCSMNSAGDVVLEVSNPGDSNANYYLDVIFQDAGGERVRDESFIVDYLRSGERAEESFRVFNADAAASCEIVDAQRYEHESPIDTAAASCAITGVDAADDLTLEIGVSNEQSESSSFLSEVVVVRDGVRVGSSFAQVDNVDAGDRVVDQAVTIIDGPVEGAVCEVVSLHSTT